MILQNLDDRIYESSDPHTRTFPPTTSVPDALARDVYFNDLPHMRELRRGSHDFSRDI